MEKNPHYWPFVRGIHRSPVKSLHKGQWRGALMFSLICARINGWVNNRETGDLRRHRAHCDVIVMSYIVQNFFHNFRTPDGSHERNTSLSRWHHWRSRHSCDVPHIVHHVGSHRGAYEWSRDLPITPYSQIRHNAIQSTCHQSRRVWLHHLYVHDTLWRYWSCNWI